jgi:hypothetical protein
MGSLNSVTDALSMIPGTGGFIQEARRLQEESDAQTAHNASSANNGQASALQAPPGSVSGHPAPGIPGMSMDPQEVIRKIYPILVFQ